MCLSVASAVEMKPKIGYKVMKVIDNHFYFSVMGGSAPTNQWLMADGPDSFVHMGWRAKKIKKYPQGFHIFKTLHAAKKHLKECFGKTNLKVVKVEYRAVVACGKQYGFAVDVAQMMKIVGMV